MRNRRPATWSMVVRAAAFVTVVAALAVLLSGTGLWLLEGNRPDSTVRSFGDALWWALTTLTTVGYGDHVPVSSAGRVIGAAVMVTGVAVIGAVAAVVALGMALRVAVEEEQVFQVEADTLEGRLEARLIRIEAQLAALDERLRLGPSLGPTDDPNP